MEWESFVPPLQKIQHPILEKRNITLQLLRIDLIHTHLSGNKWWKLKHNLFEAKKMGYTTLLTFGGAYSNHIRAVAFAGKYFGLSTIGVIRGDEHFALNPVLEFAQEIGMKLLFWSREKYRNKEQFLGELYREFGDFYLLPEGGTNQLALKGCAELWQYIPQETTIVCSAVGTGGTLAGLIVGSSLEKIIWGFPVLKGGAFLYDTICKLLSAYAPSNTFSNWKLWTDYHFGGYAKTNALLIDFIQSFIKQTNIPIEPIYTGKMLFGIFDLIQNELVLSGSKIVALHTGGIFKSEKV
ncbi:MAG: pyridoxal-phosphate dependent enzyme [Cytophagales bacterium]|nr:pyridoxal-phosphate dependent enzyme [Cytophagales bacterium]MDW8384757.1 pyridoxal-phosphate dependent enzyme [Flammeovirgaceae bacterium]